MSLSRRLVSLAEALRPEELQDKGIMLKTGSSLHRSVESVCTLTLSEFALRRPVHQCYQTSLPAYQSEVNASSRPCFRDSLFEGSCGLWKQ